MNRKTQLVPPSVLDFYIVSAPSEIPVDFEPDLAGAPEGLPMPRLPLTGDGWSNEEFNEVLDWLADECRDEGLREMIPDRTHFKHPRVLEWAKARLASTNSRRMYREHFEQARRQQWPVYWARQMVAARDRKP